MVVFHRDCFDGACGGMYSPWPPRREGSRGWEVGERSRQLRVIQCDLQTRHHIQRNVEIVAVLFKITSMNNVGLGKMRGVFLKAFFQ